MNRSLFTFLALALVLVLAGTSGAGTPAGRSAAHWRAQTSSRAGLTIRWDIVSYAFQAATVTVSTGGSASAKASDRSAITLTGSGTFGGGAAKVTGGGNWTTLGPGGSKTGSGTYQVKALIGFFAAPGTLGDPSGKNQLVDQIGDSADAHAGLALLRVAYSDGSQGTITISSRQLGTPLSVFMGIAVTKGFVGYWLHQAPVEGQDGDRTLFHLVR